MQKPARRQHFIARFYLRNFAEPMFSDNLLVFDLRSHRWEKRTPRGAGWFKDLYSMFDMEGNRTDEFDQLFKRNVEDPAAPALKKMATGEPISENERAAIALFIALTAARSPNLMSTTMTEYLDRLANDEKEELDVLTRLWSDMTGKPHVSMSSSEFLKPSSLDAVWSFTRKLQRSLLQWHWRLLKTTRDRPFITSDRPVFMVRDAIQDRCLVSFPVSSVTALIVHSGGTFNESHDAEQNARVLNRQTMGQATDFIVACNQSFPGDDTLFASPKQAHP